ncbi:acyl-CoA thioesterase [Sphingomonas endolithica]|uniref:acyl-CoA thioesterase n=1 Tax=Sphingomonas endolithica TaxID=2972485 RepID=UPI0021AFE336|nr:thioesterase family protein [Sphingomonas sp. ZFBP2030]
MRDGFAFSTRFKVRYSEIDGQKIVFNSRYLEYVDVAVTEFWPWTGIQALPDWRDTEFNVRHTEIDYLKPFKWGDEIEVFVAIAKVGGTSLTQRFHLCHAVTGDLHCAVEMVVVNVDLASARAVPHAPPVRAFLKTLLTA